MKTWRDVAVGILAIAMLTIGILWSRTIPPEHLILK
jgi:hypothetical protein